jgi:hypothetical protein
MRVALSKAAEAIANPPNVPLQAQGMNVQVLLLLATVRTFSKH